MLELIHSFLFLISVGLPFWFLLTKRSHLILAWIGITIGIEIFNIRQIVNITPFQFIGLLYLPFTIKSLPRIISTRPGIFLFLGIVLLGLMGIMFGYIFPWPDLTLSRAWNQRAEGRCIIYLVRTLSYLSASIYIMNAFIGDKKNINMLFRYILIGTSICSLGVLAEYFLKIDFFNIFCPGLRNWDLETIGRVRGLNGEPRVSAQVCAWGIIILISNIQKPKKMWLSMLILHLIAFVVVISSSGLIILFVGITIIVWFSKHKKRIRALVTFLLFICMALTVQAAESNLAKRWVYNVNHKIFNRTPLPSSTKLGEAIANHLEVFDASAFLFFWYNPQHLLLGAGPGLISIPASSYIPSGKATRIYGRRIDSIPHTGLLQIISNTGVIGFSLWLCVFILLVRALQRKKKRSLYTGDWHNVHLHFIVFSILYLLQEKAIWYIFLSMALSSVVKKTETTHKISTSVESNLRVRKIYDF